MLYISTHYLMQITVFLVLISMMDLSTLSHTSTSLRLLLKIQQVFSQPCICSHYMYFFNEDILFPPATKFFQIYIVMQAKTEE